MKKIFGIMGLALASLVIVACSDDDDAGSQYLRKSELTILSSNLNFSADADTGSVVFSAPQAATVKFNAGWAKAELNGNTVKVTVQHNPSVEGRAAQMTIYSGQDSANVTIQQLGMEYKYNGENLFFYDDATRSESYPLAIEGADVTVTSSVDWATPVVNGSQVDVTYAANEDGHIRRGSVYIEAGPYNDTITVYQGELKDIVGKTFAFAGYDMMQATSDTKSIDELFAYDLCTMDLDSNGDLFLNFAQSGYTLPVFWDQSTLTFYVGAGMPMGTYYNVYKLYDSVVDYSYYETLYNNNYLWLFSYPFSGVEIIEGIDGTGFLMAGLLDYSDKYQCTTVEFVNASSNDFIQALFEDETTTYEANCIGIDAYSKARRAANYAGSLTLYALPFMEEMTPSGAKTVRVPEKTAAKAARSQQKILTAGKFLVKNAKRVLAL